MDKLKAIKCTLEKKVYNQLDHIDDVCVEELGEVIDMIKDLSKAIYYCTIVEAMEEGKDMREITMMDETHHGASMEVINMSK